MMLILLYGFRVLESVALVLLCVEAWRHFPRDWLLAGNVHQRYTLMGMIVAYTLMFWLLPIAVKQPLGFAPHFLGTCLAYWLLGFSGGMVAMTLVVIVAFVFGGFFPQNSAVNLAQAWDVFFLLHSAFFALVVPLILLSLWRRVCHLVERWWQQSLAKAPKSLTSPPFATVHLSHQQHERSVVDYFLHFFGMVFVGTAFASAGAIFLQGFTFWALEEAGARINLYQTTFPAAMLLGYAEAFLTGIVYAALRQFRPDWVFPYVD